MFVDPFQRDPGNMWTGLQKQHFIGTMSVTALPKMQKEIKNEKNKHSGVFIVKQQQLMRIRKVLYALLRNVYVVRNARIMATPTL